MPDVREWWLTRPNFDQASEVAGQDLLRLSNEVQRLVAEHPDRPEPLLAQARLGLGPLRDARLAGAQKYAEADAKAKASVDRAFASWDFDAGVRAYDAGDRAKARELWTKAANNGHAEAAARLKAIENESP